MNFGLNKIDTDLRRKVNEKTKDGKVHRTSAVSIKTEREKNKDKTFQRYMENEEKLEKNNKRKKESIVNETFEATGELNIALKEGIAGAFLDIRR